MDSLQAQECSRSAHLVNHELVGENRLYEKVQLRMLETRVSYRQVQDG